MRSAGWGVRKEKRKTMEKKEGKNLIRERIYYAVRLELISPLCVSGGTDQNTDSDVMRNGRGECFIPGTSVAGAFRQYLDPERKKGGIFGYSKGEEGQMSEVIFSDVYFDEPAEVTRRDGVRLTEDRRVETGKKFDWEIIEPGITGISGAGCGRDPLWGEENQRVWADENPGDKKTRIYQRKRSRPLRRQGV